MVGDSNTLADEVDVLGGVELIVDTIRSERDPERLLWEVCGRTLDIFRCDRAWLLFPCDPDAPSWTVPIERTVPEYPGAQSRDRAIPMTPDVAEIFRTALGSGRPVAYGPGGLPLAENTRSFQVRSQLSMAIFPPAGKPWQFGLHQCSHGRVWTPAQIRLFRMIGIMAAEALGNLLLTRDLQAVNATLEGSVRARTAELRMERDFAEQLIEKAQGIVLLLDGQGRVLRFNPYTERISGYSLEEVKGRSWFDTFVAPAERERVRGIFEKTKMGEPTDGSTNTIVTKAGQRRVLDWYNTALRDAEGRVASVLAIGHDVTDRVAAEQRIRASLEEKEVLVKEIHHRVKNNMQVVSSLLRVQRRNMKGLADQCVLDAFTETESRIKSMALAHERLYCSQDLTDVDLAAYIPQVAGELLDTYDVPPGAVTLETRVEPVRININQGIPCGLIVNELVSNALKYAFPGGRKGRITLGFRRLHDGVHELSVHDDGVGLPEGFSPQEARTMGMAIVNALTGQLGGELSVVRGGGTCFRIRFPVGRKTAGG